jgi:hypothetical protein
VHANGARAFGLHTPSVLARLFDTQRLLIRARRRKRFDVAGVLANEIRTRRPDGHHQIDERLPVAGINRFDFHVMGEGRGKTQRVADRLERLRV